MSVLLLRLCGPMQSWGTQSRFTVRDTGLEPSKSGVVGLLCAALGRHRDEPVADLADLRMGVRVDQEGTLRRDFHTAGKGGHLKAGGMIERKNVIVSTRYYLADARFLVGLEGDDVGFLREVHTALRDPVWSLFLGRRAFVSGEPVWLPEGLCPNSSLMEILTSYPWLGTETASCPERLRLVVDDPNGSETRLDWPISFAQRRFGPRRVGCTFILAPRCKEEPCISPA